MNELGEADLDLLAAAWTRMGVLFAVPAATTPVDLERLICKTACAARFDERLFVCAASWLAEHHGFVDGRRLGTLAAVLHGQDSATLGALLSFAQSGGGDASVLDTALSHCRPLAPPRPLSDVMDTMHALRDRVRRRALPMFAVWGLWRDEATLKPSAIRPVRWLVENAPELRTRALLGPSIEADLRPTAAARAAFDL